MQRSPNSVTRRSILRTALLTAFGSLLGNFAGPALAAGTVRVPLDQWKWLVFDFGGKRIALPTSEVFAALEEAYGSVKITEGTRG